MKYEEDRMQMAVARYLDLLGVLWFHPANERKTSIQAGVRLKKKGVKSGVPDCLMLESNNTYKGLVIELKTTKGKLSENQKKWLSDLQDNGFCCYVCRSFDEAKEKIDEYFNI
jgi:hypothetical protein